MNKLHYIIGLFLIIGISSCATYKTQYTKNTKNWESNQIDFNQQPKHTVFLIGDAGNYPTLEQNPTLQNLQKRLKKANENSSVIFLGDNIYPSGFPHESEDEAVKKEAIAKLHTQLDILDGYKGRPYFTPGNHDWRGDGVLGVRRQEAYIEAYLNKGIEDEDEWEDYYLPSNACGDPQIVEVNEQLVFLFMDSDWYLRDWDKAHPSINEDCNALSRPVFRFLFEELARKYKNKNVIIVSHHPMYTYGPHGGKTSLKEHIFPLTQLSDGLYIPLPGLGTIGAVARQNLGMRQDVAHPIYKQMKRDVLAGATKNGSFIFASGHEHSLQYIELDKQKFIVSGAGSKKSPVALGKGSQFAHGGKGYSIVEFYEDGSAYLSMYITKEDGGEELAYFQKIKDKLPISEENIPSSFPEFEQAQETVTRKPTLLNISGADKGAVYNAVLGEHYRDLYLAEYDFPVLDLTEFQGVGAYPIKRGGGNQTNSLRLKTNDGRQFAMRALTKDASRLVPYPINKMTAANSLAEENFMSTHPFAPLVIPQLASACNIYHTNPKLYYVPKQPALGVHNDMFGGDVYLIEERPSKGHEAVESFGTADKFYGTPDVVGKITHSSKHQIDQNWVLRSRLFDMMIGDWDRHDDQWRWSMKKEDGKRVYRPIPRDRDQAFSKYDGIVSGLARLFMPFLRQLKSYSGEIEDETRWDNWSSRFFNMTFLNEIPWEEWEKEALYIQNNMTDEIIEEAFKEMPPFAYEQTAADLMAMLKERRDNVVRYAREFYEFYSDEIVVLGTDKKERFEVTRQQDGMTLVEVYHKDEKVYSRLFDKKVTKEIHLYGMGNDDTFNIKGKTNKSSLIRVIGGVGDDQVKDESQVSGGSKKTKVYDTIDGIKIESVSEAKDKTSKYKLLNYFDRRDVQYEHNFDTKLPILGFNPDDGFILGGAYRLINYKFKKYPYAQEHNVRAMFGFATQAVDIRYDGLYIETVGRWDLHTNLRFHSPRNTFNYFGFGNETTRDKDNRQFNEARLSYGWANLNLRKRFANNSAYFQFGPMLEWVDVQPTENRLVTSDVNGLPADIFNSQFYAGVGVELDYRNIDNFADPKQGIRFNTKYNWRYKVEEPTGDFSALRAHFTFYLPIDRQQNFVLASRVGGGFNLGEGYQFYHAPTIGGAFLRGFRNERFLGDRAFFHNTDLRLKILSSTNKVLPFSIGLHTGFDYGRVWLDDVDEGRKLHYSYGGGFWLAPVDIAIISFGYYTSEDDARLIIKAGHSF